MARILVVDDQELMRDSLATALAREGHEVVAAGDGAAALQRLTAPAGGGRFDLMITDLRMARLSDMDTLELARRESAHLYEQDPALDQPEHALLRAQLARFWELASTAPEA